MAPNRGTENDCFFWVRPQAHSPGTLARIAASVVSMAARRSVTVGAWRAAGPGRSTPGIADALRHARVAGRLIAPPCRQAAACGGVSTPVDAS